ncbi:[FeFe] hydrogenase H-cluster radical SAM maturase HydE [Proteiniclasticum sp. SCR006]|uniref:[FeFe] hydrogenase H-cluster radical SAM maturase HydE n=1 Tax=Proteiniclasticum aestuarii TaxID=2817862 RepID=A0A939H8U7_9CLOT|nr:[FeFe] hydrogenase H-cluster radical SAM maturase HydE [Proteiniclasticum aestuarii]MBO1266364.1 [FeFe] hydrogenase H-cluster radical SAM maturase HydE [Proteiniclasticum aestuarii]
MTRNEILIRKLARDHSLSEKEFRELIESYTEGEFLYARSLAGDLLEETYGKRIYIRGLIELTSYCMRDCHYCGIRRGNQKAERYRLTEEEVLSCCSTGYELGFRTFVLQGGEDPYFTDERLVKMIGRIRQSYPDCAITLSLGERSRESYQKLYNAGANRYLLRHETAEDKHFEKLHPVGEKLAARTAHLYALKEIGYQVGTGFMVGSPYQSSISLAKDLCLIHEIQPEMVGIGPFVPHKESIFRDFPSGSVELTLFLLALIRIMLPDALIPATTSLGTVDGKGREKGVLSGANVVMPNLSPMSVRKKYILYDNKAYTGSEAAESLHLLKESMGKIGFEVVVNRGDHSSRQNIMETDASRIRKEGNLNV